MFFPWFYTLSKNVECIDVDIVKVTAKVALCRDRRCIVRGLLTFIGINPIPQELVDEGTQKLVNFPTLSSAKERMGGRLVLPWP